MSNPHHHHKGGNGAPGESLARPPPEGKRIHQWQCPVCRPIPNWNKGDGKCMSCNGQGNFNSVGYDRIVHRLDPIMDHHTDMGDRVHAKTAVAQESVPTVRVQGR